AVARDFLGAVRVILRGEVAGGAPADGDALLDCGAGLDLFVVRLLVAAPALEQVVEWRYHADADRVIVLRDVPPPALLVRRLDDQRGAFVAARVAVGPFPVSPDGALVEHRVPEAQFEAVLQHRALAAGIDNDLRPHLLLGTVFVLNAHADG